MKAVFALQNHISITRPLRPMIVGLLLIPVLAGCLQTRSAVKEQEEKQVLKKQVATLQQSTADVSARFQDIEDELRKVNGRIETVENQVGQTAGKIDKGDAALDVKFKENADRMVAYREEIARLSGDIDALKAQVAAMQEEQKKSASQAAATAAAKEKNPFATAEEKFEGKNWKEAILDYEKYRKGNPKGKQFAEATYKIGVAFQELGQGDVAQAFYEEVIAKFPKGKEATRAKGRLKSLAKK